MKKAQMRRTSSISGFDGTRLESNVVNHRGKSGAVTGNALLGTFPVVGFFDSLLAFQSDRAIKFGVARRDGCLLEKAEQAMALLLLMILSPVMLACSILIRFSAPGSIFYNQVRIGKFDRPFRIYKFRTMIPDAEAKTGAVLSTRNDPRVTTIGKFLRNTHLDELPQLWNIYKGDMSFIGPRPERPEFVRFYKQSIPLYSLRHHSKPGVTGLAQVCLPYDSEAHVKLQFDLAYFQNISLWMDFKIIFCTIVKVFFVRYNK